MHASFEHRRQTPKSEKSTINSKFQRKGGLEEGCTCGVKKQTHAKKKMFEKKRKTHTPKRK